MVTEMMGRENTMSHFTQQQQHQKQQNKTVSNHLCLKENPFARIKAGAHLELHTYEPVVSENATPKLLFRVKKAMHICIS